VSSASSPTNQVQAWMAEQTRQVVKYQQRTTQSTDQFCQEHSLNVPFSEDDFLLSGDDVVLNYNATFNGEEFAHNKEEGLLVSLGKKQLIEPIEEQLIGLRVGDKKEFDVDGPVLGKENGTFHFTVEVVAASKVNPAPLNEELAKKFNFETVEQLKQNVEKQAVSYASNHKINMIKQKVMDLLVEKNTFNLPSWMTIEAAMSIAQQYGAKLEQLQEEQRQSLFADAEKRLRLTFILDKIKDIEPDTVLSDQELFSMMQENFNKFDPKVKEQIQKGNQQVMSAAASDIQAQYVVEWVAKRVKFVQKGE
jgi:trigger factor